MTVHPPPPARSPLAAWREVVGGLDEPGRLRERVAAQAPAPEIALSLVRHGETTTNAGGLITGTTDAPLTVAGRLHAQESGRALAGASFDVGFTSQLRRTSETLELMIRAGGLVVPETAVDVRLAERSLGELERTPIRPRDPRLAYDLTLAPTGGESYVALARRCLAFLLDLRDLAALLRRPLAVLVCTSTGPMRVVSAILDECDDAVAMRDRRFANGEIVQRSLGLLHWPVFAGGLPSIEEPTR